MAQPAISVEAETQPAADNYEGVWGQRIGFGRKPALVVIDFMKAYTTPGAPLFAQGVVEAVARMPDLLAAARQAGVLVIHTNILYRAPNCADGGVWVKKAPVMAALVPGSPLAEFCDGVEPLPGELVVTKQYASAFFGTSLAPMLHADGIDTVARRVLDQRLHPGECRGRGAARLPHHRGQGLRRRQARRTARGQPLRYRCQVWRRRRPEGGGGRNRARRPPNGARAECVTGPMDRAAPPSASQRRSTDGPQCSD